MDYYTLSAEKRLEKTQSRKRGSSYKSDYYVRHGDSLWKIAKKHKVSVQSLAKWNGMAPGDMIRPGQKLVVWKKGGGVVSNTSHYQRDKMIRKIGYVVRRGDSLARIAGKFNVKVSEISRWNKLDSSRYLQPGQYLTLYVDITRMP